MEITHKINDEVEIELHRHPSDDLDGNEGRVALMRIKVIDRANANGMVYVGGDIIRPPAFLHDYNFDLAWATEGHFVYGRYDAIKQPNQAKPDPAMQKYLDRFKKRREWKS